MTTSTNSHPPSARSFRRSNRKDPHETTVKLYGEPLKEVDRYKYLGLPFGAKGLDTGRMYEVSIARAVRTASLFHSIGCNGEGFSTAVSRRVLTSIVRPSTEYGMALVNLSKGQQMAVGEANGGGQGMAPDLEENAVSAGSGKWQCDTQGSRSTAYVIQASKLNVCFVARVYDAGPDALNSQNC